MQVFATAGGGGEAADLCFFVPAYFALSVGFVAGCIGFIRTSTRATIISAILACIFGTLVLLAAAGDKPSTDPDEQGNQNTMHQLVWWSVATASVAVISVVRVALARYTRNFKMPTNKNGEPGA
jgi:hypothetical protein